ncbi:hypothetical protein AXF42_Ash011060 [Apostasia shenzhenica]|uniref:Uncharacterized protein n=1 Tax=Apostasia shenzhenica TaxID=1088818 RepID=A0A2H9ZR10_9ASPA|nr:hypothetical protein AXF42_Ash011060 [Apostasia shenzhenica]
MASLCHLLLLLLFSVVTMSTMAHVHPVGPFTSLPHAADGQRIVTPRFVCEVLVAYYNQFFGSFPNIYNRIYLTLLSERMEASTQLIRISNGDVVRWYYGHFYARMHLGSALTLLVRVKMWAAVPTNSRLSFNLDNVIYSTVGLNMKIRRIIAPDEHIY